MASLVRPSLPIGPRKVAPPDLDSLAADIKATQDRIRAGQLDLLEGYLAQGRALIVAREQLPSKPEFGAWFRAQDFPFSQQWAWTLREAAANESVVREAITTQVVNGQQMNLKKAVQKVRNAEAPEGVPLPDPPTGKFSVITADPPWRYGNAGTRGNAAGHYPTMPLEDIRDLGALVDDWAADNSHLYLWTTTSFLRDSFEVMDAWGFKYKTCLTWVKPQLGMGNYFRVSTEFVLFGVRGKLPIHNRGLTNWFESPRGKHSAKPEMFYSLVEKASPGPYLEMFARVDGQLFRRDGWTFWGNEAQDEEGHG